MGPEPVATVTAGTLWLNEHKELESISDSTHVHSTEQGYGSSLLDSCFFKKSKVWLRCWDPPLHELPCSTQLQ